MPLMDIGSWVLVLGYLELIADYSVISHCNLRLLFTTNLHNFTSNSFPMIPNALKSAFLIAAIAIIPALLVNAQSGSWSVPLPVSDSFSDNRNAIVKEILLNGSGGHYIFWERSVDQDATAIYYNDFYNAYEPVELLSATNVHYRNPQIMLTTPLDNDTLFYFFYESDQDGDFDIYYMVNTFDGFGGPELLTGSPGDETHFRCNDGGTMAWQEDGKIKSARLVRWNSPFIISDPVTIDSINCSDPEVSPAGFYSSHYISWLKTVEDSAAIYYSYGYNGSWSEPQPVDDPGNSASLRFAETACFGGGGLDDLIVWESISGNEHTIKAQGMWGGDYSGNFYQEDPFLPSFMMYTVPVDELNYGGFLTFVNAIVQNGDIYASDDGMWIPEDLEYFFNLSDSPFEETNPALFNGRCFDYVCDVINVWESKRNDHWQLYYSLTGAGCWGSVSGPDQPVKNALDISPNPVREACDISYTLAESASVTLQLYTMDGRQIVLVNRQFHEKGDYNYHLDFNKIFPEMNYSGLVMVKMQAGNNTATQKIIRTR